jgi:rod shape-determining protein MreD
VSLALIFTVVMLQVSVFQRIEIGNASPDVLILVVMSLALLSSSVEGAVYGFAAGIMLELSVGLLLGPHAMIATIVGYAAGRWGEQLVTDEHPVPPLLAGLIATFAMQVGRPLVEFLVAPSSATAGAIWSDVMISTVLGVGLSIPVYLLVRRILRSLCGDDAIAPVGGEA